MEEYRDLHLTVESFRRVLDEPEFRRAPGRDRVAGVRPRFARGPRRAVYVVGLSPRPWRLRHPRTDREGREPRHGAGRRRARGVGARDVPEQGRCRRELQAHGRARVRGRRERRPARWRRQPQPFRHRVGPHRTRSARARQSGRDRDARGNGARASPRGSRRRRRVVALCAGRDRRRLRRRDRVPVAPARRERVGGELPARALLDHARFTRVAGASNAGSKPRSSQRHTVSTAPRRTQDRRTEQRTFDPEAPFANEPDTDFTTAGNREWVAHHLDADRPEPLPALLTTTDAIDAVVARAERGRARMVDDVDGGPAPRAHPRRRGHGREPWAHARRHGVRDRQDRSAKATPRSRKRSTWRAGPPRRRTSSTSSPPTASSVHRSGPWSVAAPWNFPYAIPANGVVAALATGNAAILKPAPEAVATAVELVRHLHEAGVPPDAVQLVRCPDDDAGRHLITHDGVDTVVLTGAYDDRADVPRLEAAAATDRGNERQERARRHRRRRPRPRDQAISCARRSATPDRSARRRASRFVEAGIYDDERFLAADRRRRPQHPRRAAARPRDDDGSARASTGRQASPRAARTLDAGEQWLVEPQRARRDAAGSGARAYASACDRDRGSTAPNVSGRCSASSAPATSTMRSRCKTRPSSG